jgi:hypothetical protein
MIDRHRLEAILGHRFPGSRSEQIAAAANAIMGLERESSAAANWHLPCGDDQGEVRPDKIPRRRDETPGG